MSSSPSSLLSLLTITVCHVGIQFTWTVEFGYGTAYLLSLGMSKVGNEMITKNSLKFKLFPRILSLDYLGTDSACLAGWSAFRSASSARHRNALRPIHVKMGSTKTLHVCWGSVAYSLHARDLFCKRPHIFFSSNYSHGRR